MLAAVLSYALVGIDAHPVRVEVDITSGLPQTATVGLPDHVVRESKDRIRAALRNSGFELPPRRVTVSLAPAQLRKEGAGYDLPIALAMLAASDLLPASRLAGLAIAGELALDGTVRAVRGAVSMAAAAQAAGHRRVLVPAANAAEAALVDGIDAVGVASLREAVDVLAGTRVPVLGGRPRVVDDAPPPGDLDLADVRGQTFAKRAIEVAAAGGHNVLLIGPPGCGKTMLARRVSALLPPLSFAESLEVTKIHSAAGLLVDRPLVASRPFRAPHHTVSAAGMLGGGGAVPRPGELALAHRGVLFLDELPEFRRDVLEGLRQPLEERRVALARAGARVVYPAHVMLVAAMNPCPCGHLGDPGRVCRCTPHQLVLYRTRLSGPLLDRIDLHVELGPVAHRELGTRPSGESSAAVRARVLAARARQTARVPEGGPLCNADLGARELQAHARPDAAGAGLVEATMSRLGLSARAYTRILKVARTVADLAGAEGVGAPHVAEAIRYRCLDRDRRA